MKSIKLIFVSLFFVFSSAEASFTFHDYATSQPQEYPDLTGSFLSGYSEATKAAALHSQLEENLNQAKLQNQLLAIRLKTFLDSHPKIAKDLANKEEARRIIARNSGLKSMFRSSKAYTNELRQCANHGNRYCKIMLNEAQQTCKRKQQC